MNNAAPLLRVIGARVRQMRANAALTRRELSEKSNVSPRHLAQLESGRGNVSIALLNRVALALDTSVVDLLTPGNLENMDLAKRFENATSQQRQQVLHILTPPKTKPPGRIALIGLRGAGKSTIGPVLAARLNLRFVELNDLIRQSSGMPIAEVFALYGEAAYRRLERQALGSLERSGDSMVLAVAGGIVSAPETFEYLLSRYHTVWLRAAATDHMMRVRAQGDLRPASGNPDAMADLQAILGDREALYAKADHVVNTSGITAKTAAAKVFEVITGNGKDGPIS